MGEQNNEKKNSESVKTGLKVVIGVILIILGLWAVIAWLPSLLTVIKGFIGLFLIAAGAITIAIAKE